MAVVCTIVPKSASYKLQTVDTGPHKTYPRGNRTVGSVHCGASDRCINILSVIS
jgi:hypothetical protein